MSDRTRNIVAAASAIVSPLALVAIALSVRRIETSQLRVENAIFQIDDARAGIGLALYDIERAVLPSPDGPPDFAP